MKTVVKVALSAVTLVAVAAGSVAGTLAYLMMQTEPDVNVMAVGEGIAIKQIELQRAEGVKHIHTAQNGDLVPFEQKQVLAPAYPVNGLNSDYTAEPTDLFNWGDYVYTGTAGNGLWNDEKLKGVIDKFVFVENTGDADCYFRSLFAFECPEGFSIGEASAGAQIMLNVNGREDGSAGGYLWTDVGYATIGATRYAITEAVYIAKDDILPAGAKSHPSLLQVVMTHNATNEDIKKLNGEYEILVMSQACQTENFTNAADALDNAFGKVTPERAKEWFSVIYAADTDWYTENPSAAEFTISDANELYGLATLVNEKKVSFANKTIKLGANIDLTGFDWEPIGQTGNTLFKGTFDGQNYTISNLKVDSNAETNEHYASGLFGWIEGKAKIRNLTLDQASVEGHHYVGGIAGYCYGVIENCHVTNSKFVCTHANDDADGDKCGAIVGYLGEATSAVRNCTVSDTTISAGRDAGQVVGAGVSSVVTGCTATNVTVTANGTSNGNNIRNEVVGRIL